MNFIKLPGAREKELTILPISEISVVGVTKVLADTEFKWEVRVLFLVFKKPQSLLWEFNNRREAMAFIEAHVWPQLDSADESSA